MQTAARLLRRRGGNDAAAQANPEFVNEGPSRTPRTQILTRFALIVHLCLARYRGE